MNKNNTIKPKESARTETVDDLKRGRLKKSGYKQDDNKRVRNYGKEFSKKSTERKQTIATTQHVQCVISITHFLSVLI